MNKGHPEDLSNQRFGLLTAIRRVENKILPSGQNQTVWECKCDCGSIVHVRSATLKNGDTRSCGCVKSHGEREVAACLTSLAINFRKEYTFSDCVNANGNRLRFDFALFNNNHL